MKYCFFDIECANCWETGKICEFGYVLTNEAFNEIESDEYIINPKAPFDEFVLKNILAYPETVYEKSPDYSFFYDKIKRLFDLDDVIYIGHTIDSDAKYLNDESERYNKPYFNYKFYDAKYMYSSYSNIEEGVGLEKISQSFENKARHHEHRAKDDAFTTMFIVKEMCEKLGVDVTELINLSEDCVGETIDGKITTVIRERAKQRRHNSMSHSNDNYIKFMQFLNGVKCQGEIIPSELNGKSLTITLNYQKFHFKEMLSLIQLLKNHDCTYKSFVGDCDYMVTTLNYNKDGSEKPCSRLMYAYQAINNGKNIKIITLEELLSILNVTEKQLFKMPFPDESSFVEKPKWRKEQSNHSVKNRMTTTLGDLLKAQGIDLNDFVES